MAAPLRPAKVMLKVVILRSGEAATKNLVFPDAAR